LGRGVLFRPKPKKEGELMRYRSSKDFKIFEEEVNYWIDFFKLYNWYIRTIFINSEDDEEFNFDTERDAWSIINHKDHMSLICLNKKNLNFKELNTDYELRMIAFHEVCEVLLFPLALLGEDTYSENVIVKNTHIIINHLENSVFKRNYEERKNKNT